LLSEKGPAEMYEDYKHSLYYLVNNVGGGGGPGHKKVPPILKVVLKIIFNVV
jgi:hypothetical protein